MPDGGEGGRRTGRGLRAATRAPAGFSRFLKSFATVALGNAGAKIILLGTAPVISRLYSPADYGVSGIVIAMAASAMVVSTLRYDKVILTSRSARARGNVVALCAVLLAVGATLLALGIGTASVVQGLGVVSEWARAHPVLLLAPVLMAVHGVEQNILQPLLIVSGAFRRLAVLDFARGAATSGGQIALGLAGFGPLGLVLGRVAGHAASVMLQLAAFGGMARIGALRRHMSAEGMRRVARANYRQAVYLTPAVTLNLVASYLPLMLFTPLFGVTAAGSYYFINALAMNVLTFFNSNAPSLVVRDVSQRRQSGQPVTPFLLRLVLLIGVPAHIVAGVMAVWGVEFVVLVFGPQWRQGGEVFQYTAFIYAIIPTVFSINAVTQIFGNQKINMAVQALRVGGTAAGILYAGSQHDFMAAVQAVVIVDVTCYTFGALLAMHYIRRDDRLRRAARA